MTRAPWVLPKPSRAFPAGNVTAVSTTLGWRLVNDRMRAEWTVSLGEANEQLAETYGIGRERQDEFAARSHNVAAAAWDAGFYDDLVVPVPGVGAIVIGHPLGASGARIVATLFKRLHELGERWGVAAICVGVGRALAVVLENLRTEAS